MINFRFHLVSLIAVFLALALGIVMGATVIDQAIVDTLNARIDDVRSQANAQRSENSDLQEELDRVRSYVEGTDDFMVAGRLDGVPVAVLAVRGVDTETVVRAVELARAAGAVVPGLLWLEEKWLLDNGQARRQIADVLGATGDEPVETLRDSGLAALGERLASGTAPIGTDLLVTLVEAQFVTFEPVGDQEGDDLALSGYPGGDARVLLVDGTDSDPEMNTMLEPAARAFVAIDLPLVVGEVFREQEDGPGRGSRLGPVRDHDDLTRVVSTVDDLDRAEGRVTAVLALANIAHGIVGQYGTGAGANQEFPEAAPR